MAIERTGDLWKTTWITAAILLAPANLTLSVAQSQPRMTMQSPSANATTAPIRDSLGRPCLDIEAAARAQIINPQMLDHIVSIENKCAKLLKVKICYVNSDNCRDLDLQPYKRADTVLGSMRGSGFFRYMIKQR